MTVFERWHRFARAGVLYGMVCLLGGCGGAPDIISTDKASDQKYSNADVRYMAVDQPFMISGNYFRNRSPESSRDLAAVFTGKETAEKEGAESKGRVSFPEKQVESHQQTVEQLMNIKVGLLVDQRQVDTTGARLLTNTAYMASSRFPIVPVAPGQIGESLSRQQDLNPNDLARISGILAIFPGVRMLMLVEKFQLPIAYPGKATAIVNLVDSGIMHRYSPLEITMDLKEETDSERFADSVVSTAFDQAVRHSEIMPWFCRPFSHEEQIWYINAGKDSGLKPGDRLKVVCGGKVVKAPSGVPAGWIPGKTKGVLRVDSHFGRDLSVCSLIEGSGPDGEDLLMK